MHYDKRHYGAEFVHISLLFLNVGIICGNDICNNTESINIFRYLVKLSIVRVTKIYWRNLGTWTYEYF